MSRFAVLEHDEITMLRAAVDTLELSEVAGEALHLERPTTKSLLETLVEHPLVEGMLVDDHHTLIGFNYQIGIKNLNKPAGRILRGEQVRRQGRSGLDWISLGTQETCNLFF